MLKVIFTTHQRTGKSIVLFILLLSFSTVNAFNQSISSDLPFVYINTNGLEIPENSRIMADMGIIYNGQGVLNRSDESFNNYSGKITIEIRGSSSTQFEKKSYGFSTANYAGADTNVVLLDMPEENDWILYAPFSDKSLMRNLLTFELAAQFGHYQCRGRFVELFVNDDYRGVYVLMEKIKRDKNRVDISKLLDTDVTGDELTGGYIVKIDRLDNPPAEGWFSPYDFNTYPGVGMVYVYPKPENILPIQKNYIQSYITDFEDVINSEDFADPEQGYRKYIDVNSFVDLLVMNELNHNVDAYRISTFFYKDKTSKGGKLFAGPLWDCDLTFGNADYCQAWSNEGWGYDFASICPSDGWFPPIWWNKFMSDPGFVNTLKCHWEYFRKGPLRIESIYERIDSIASYLEEAQERNFERWPILGTYVWPNYEAETRQTYTEEVDFLKEWISRRISWLDENFPGNCQLATDLPKTFLDLTVNIYPNPAKDYAWLNFNLDSPKNLQIQLISVNGIHSTLVSGLYDVGENSVRLDLSKQIQGIYLVVFYENGEMIFSKKVVKY
jgi:hypothetical protein